MVSKTLFQSQTMEWPTPKWLFDELNSKFHFTLDPCCTHENAKCEKHYTKDEDGLAQSWEGERVFCNPPYGKEISKWMRKCAESDAELVVALCPARTDTAWFHDWVYKKADILFIRGRLKFGEAKNSAPFPSMVCIYRRVKPMRPIVEGKAFYSEGTLCKSTLHSDALAYIQQLESHLAQVERENKAMLHDMARYTMCGSCKHFSDREKCPQHDECVYGEIGRFEWRGVCEENTEEDGNV